jgi:glycosyltransferase involved in cell wall biosynthesis
MRQAQVNVVPTRCDEAFGLSTVEGMACGLPTVAARTGGTPEVVGEAALLFEREDVHGLANHLAALLEDDQLRAEYSRRAIECARQYSPERMWKRLSELLPL